MSTTTIDLKYPLHIDGTQIGRIALRRPQVRDIMAVKDLGSQADQELELLSLLSEPHLTRQHVLTLDLQDYRVLQGVLAQLMGGATAQAAAAKH